MQLGLGLLESLGLHRSLLLEVGLFRTQLGVELLQRLRPLGEFDRFVRGLFPKGAFARLDLEESLFGLLRSAFGARLHLRRGPPRFLGGLLAALEVLVASSDPVDVGPDLFFLFFDVDFARLNPHYPIGPRGTRRSGVLLERVSLVLEQRLLGLQGRLPGPSLLGRLRLLAPQSNRLFLEFFGAARAIGLSGIEVDPDLVGLRCLDFEGLLPTRQFRETPGVFVRLGADGLFLLSEGLFAGLELDLPGQDGLTPFAVRGIESFLLLSQAKLTLADRLGLTVQVVPTSARCLVVLVLALLEFSSIGLERPARFLEDHAVLVDRDLAAGQLLLAPVERLGSRRQFVLASFQIGFLLVRQIRPLREA